jgi:hypothetical protein
MNRDSTGSDVDPITVELLSNAFRAICDEASALLAKGAYGATISEGHDHSGSLLTREARLVAHGRRDQAAQRGPSRSPSGRPLSMPAGSVRGMSSSSTIPTTEGRTSPTSR